MHVHIAYGSGPLQFGELYLPDSVHAHDLHPVVILIHGGFWRAYYGLDLMRALAEDLTRHGIAAWNIEYRRVGDAGGGWPGTLEDVAHATDFLHVLATIHHLDIQRVIVVGHSAGGHLAFWLAARHRLSRRNALRVAPTPLAYAGVISLAGAVDLHHVAHLHLGSDAAMELLDGTPDMVPERYAIASPAALLPFGIPQVLIHGTHDDRVPIEVSQAYACKAQEAGEDVTLIELPGVDHFALIDPSSQAWATTAREIQRLLSM